MSIRLIKRACTRLVAFQKSILPIIGTRGYQTSRFKTVERRIVLKLPKRKPRLISSKLWETISSLQISISGRPNIIYDSERAMPKAGYYAVAAGRKVGIYTTWSETEDQVKGYAGAKYKKFPTEAQAREYISSSGSTASSTSAPYPSTIKPPAPSITTSIETHTRASSPPTESSLTALPPELTPIAKRGYTFSKGPPWYVIVYTDGSARGNGQIGSRAGAGVWWGSQGAASARNVSERVPGNPQTNNRGELLAVIRALEQCPFPDIPLEIRCDSQYTISCMTTWLPKWLKTNFRTSTNNPNSRYANARSGPNGGGHGSGGGSKEVMNVDMIKHLLVLLRRRGSEGRVKFKYVPAHSGVEGNEYADRLANMGAMMPPVEARTDWLDPDMEVEGAPKDVATSGLTDVQVDIDENWLMTPDELANFERGFEPELEG